MISLKGRLPAAAGVGVALLLCGSVLADPLPTLARFTAGMEAKTGLLPAYVDHKTGRVWLAFKCDAKGECGEFLYLVSMRTGLGSTPVGIDRSNPGAARLIAFHRIGERLIAELPNTSFNADQGGAAEQQAARESFPSSVIWAGDVAAEEGDVALVNATSFIARDAFDVVGALKSAKQGDFTLAADRTFVAPDDVQVFPKNIEFEATETFTSTDPGDEVRNLSPDPHAVTLIEHQSLIALPPPGFTPRLADPRTGAFDNLVVDYGAPLGQPTVRRLATRFRLEKLDPAAVRSPVKTPIVFYVDRAAPPPVRQALIDGARWWRQAFDEAGFVDAFRVEVMPEGASPLDARYNVINWVHRQTRGWSYGYPISDPRTGEIVKGAVLLGSLRVRQDLMIFQGLEGADATGAGGPNDPITIALARLRQLAVHETGHALGLAHNFAASTYGDRASVMDYPPPRISVVDGKLDFSDAYKVGIGDWDRFAIKWLYADTPSGPAGAAALESIVRDATARGLRYVRDEDARPVGSAHPLGALWDDGSDSIAALKHILEVRRITLDSFGERNVPSGAPLSDLRRVIVPIYLLHRYEVEAVAKSVGGVDFTYAVRGDLEQPARVVDGLTQRRALRALLDTLDPRVLDLPDNAIDLLSAGRDGSLDHAYEIELFAPADTPAFSLGEAARAAVDVTLTALLDPARLTRLADQGARNPAALGLNEVMKACLERVFDDVPLPQRQAALRRVVRARLTAKLAVLATDKAIDPTVSAEALAGLEWVGRKLSQAKSADPIEIAFARQISAIAAAPQPLADFEAKRRRDPPPGMPIGAADGDDGWLSESIQPGGLTDALK